MNKTRLGSSFSLLVLLPLAAAAHGDGSKAGKEGKKAAFAACRPDQEKFCGDVEPGGGRIVACMAEHEKDLSDACRELVSAKKDEMGKRKAKDPAAAACAADQKRLCGDVEPGESGVVACMADHKADLSKACRSAMAKKDEETKRAKKNKEKEPAESEAKKKDE